MNVLSVFDGISCGRVALERAGIKLRRHQYFASEIDKYCLKISKKNYKDIVHLGDVKNWRTWQLPKIDLLIGGSPCQGFSVSGKGGNFDDTRSALFFEYLNILNFHKPKYFLLENVKMKKEWQDMITFLTGFYPVEINSALVSAQNRRRLYWTNIPFITQPADKGILLKDILEDGINTNQKSFPVDSHYINTSHSDNGIRQFANSKRQIIFNKVIDKALTLQSSNYRGLNRNQHSTAILQTAHGYNNGGLKALDGKTPSLTSNYYQENNKVIYPAALRGRPDENGKNIQKLEISTEQKSHSLTSVEKDNVLVEKIGHFENNSQTQRIYSVNNKSICLCDGDTAGAANGHYKIDLPDGDYIIRKLTPIECERLQTLPDNYTAGVSNSQRYKMLGNGWNVDTIAHILKFIKL